MTIDEIREKVKTDEEYNFLKTNEHLGRNTILLGLGGSYAYGTNKETSDIDIRGIALPTRKEIILNQNWEQVINNVTDTTVYDFRKIIKLLTDCNPNTIEILGLRPNQYLYLSQAGKLLLENKKLFLSQKAIYTFGGYAKDQLRRCENKSARVASQSEQEKHILESISHAFGAFKENYTEFEDDAIKMYIDKAVNEDFDKEIFLDINLHHYPLRDYKDIILEMQSIEKAYSKIGKRNNHAIKHEKLGKHMMHLVRLYLMCLDILEKEEINTYRENDIPFLMEIRNGKYLDDNKQVIPEFFDIIRDLDVKLEEAAKNTSLPKDPNRKEIDELTYTILYDYVIKES